MPARRVGLGFAIGLMAMAAVAADAPPRLQVESRIALGDVRGRIDHLAIDVAHRRLFVAELGNGSVSVVDLDRRAVTQRLKGFEEPQGVAWSAAGSRLYVATGGDGKLFAFQGEPLKEASSVSLGDDADNVRLDPAARQVIAGFGRGALASLDESSLKNRSDVPLGGHPESFQLEKGGSRVFVNVPDAHQVVVVDRESRAVVARWPTPGVAANFPMALDEKTARLFVGFRQPAMLGVFSTRDGTSVTRVPSCGDTDDLFIDDRRQRVYVVCGEGRVDVFDAMPTRVARIGSTPTLSGARTGLWSPDLDRLFVAVRASGGQPAAIWVLKPLD